MRKISLTLSESKVMELEEKMRETGITTKISFFNHALSFFCWAIKERKNGKIIASIDEDGKVIKEIVMPGL